MKGCYQEYECECKITDDGYGKYDIEYCPKHAAAPDMYEALRQMIVDYQYLCDQKPQNALLQTRLKMAQQALAKAEGKV